MSLYSAQQQTFTGAGNRLDSVPKPDQQAETRTRIFRGHHAASNEAPRSIPGLGVAPRKTNDLDEMVKKSASGGYTERRPNGPWSGKPALYMVEEDDAVLWERGLITDPSLLHVSHIRLGAESSLVAPFSKRAEGIDNQKTPLIPPKDQKQLQSPTKTQEQRRSSAANSDQISPLFKPADQLDCTFWTGDGLEDRLTEQAIKTGFLEKVPVLNEFNTAKYSLSPHLKNGTGLRGLSSLLSAVLQRRQESGRITAATVFKPPPRVTLTDMKRESWLRDLANPAVTLRKQSRTIPHGIRGKTLLDQCLAKNVPMIRAVWVARCVGANELRTLRRKGMNGAIIVDNENKWVREWSGLVETFVQECIDRRDMPDWKSRISYAMQLASCFYAAGLLDKDHFLGWILSNLENYSIDMLPMSFMFLHQYWSELTASLKYGHRLTRGCFQRLTRLQESLHKDLYDAVIRRLQYLVRKLALRHPSCCLLPDIGIHISLCLNPIPEGADRGALQHIVRRISRLACLKNGESSPESRKTTSIVSILDCAKPPFFISAMSSLCVAAASDLQHIVQTIMQWAASTYRSGNHRIYLASRLIRDLFEKGFDVNTCILNSISAFRNMTGILSENLSNLVAELLRSNVFDVGRYLRRLIATGALNNFQAGDKRLPYDVQLLLDLPREDLSTNIANLRLMLLRGIGLSRSWQMEHDDIEVHLEHLVAQTREPSQYDSQGYPLHRTVRNDFCLSARRHISTNLLERVATSVAQSRPVWDTVPTSTDHHGFESYIEVAKFRFTQGVLTDFQDYSALDRFYRATVERASMTNLVSITESLAYNLEIHDSITPAQTLCEAVFQRYRTLRLTSLPLRAVADPLLKIASRLSFRTEIQKYLKREIVMADQSLALAACTPMSDIQIDTSDHDEDFEQLVLSSTVDKYAIEKIGEAIATRVQTGKTFQLGLGVMRSIIHRLRSGDEPLFDSLMMQWLFARTDRPDFATLGELTSLLVQLDCLSLATLVQRVEEQLAGADQSTAEKVALDALIILLPFSAGGAIVNTQTQFCNENPQTLLRLLGRTLSANGPAILPGEDERMQAVLANEYMLNAINRMLLGDQATFCAALDLQDLVQNERARIMMKSLVFRILDPKGQLDLSGITIQTTIGFIFENVDAISLPMFQFGLYFLTLASNQMPGLLEDIPAMMAAAVESAITRNCVLWPRLLSRLHHTINKAIREKAEGAFFNGVAPSKLSDNPHEADWAPVDALRKALDVIEATASSVSGKGETGMAPAICARLDTIAQALDTVDLALSQDHIDRKPSATLQKRLRLLLRLALIHRTSLQRKDLIFNSNDGTVFLCTLCRLAITHSTTLNVETIEYIFDVAIYFARDLTTRETSTFHNALGPLTQHPRIRFLLGIQLSPTRGLHVTSFLKDSVSTSQQQQHGHSGEVQSSTPFVYRPWELLNDFTAHVGINDTSLNLRLFRARKM